MSFSCAGSGDTSRATISDASWSIASTSPQMPAMRDAIWKALRSSSTVRGTVKQTHCQGIDRHRSHGFGSKLAWDAGAAGAWVLPGGPQLDVAAAGLWVLTGAEHGLDAAIVGLWVPPGGDAAAAGLLDADLLRHGGTGLLLLLLDAVSSSMSQMTSACLRCWALDAAAAKSAGGWSLGLRVDGLRLRLGRWSLDTAAAANSLAGGLLLGGNGCCNNHFGNNLDGGL